MSSHVSYALGLLANAERISAGTLCTVPELMRVALIDTAYRMHHVFLCLTTLACLGRMVLDYITRTTTHSCTLHPDNWWVSRCEKRSAAIFSYPVGVGCEST